MCDCSLGTIEPAAARARGISALWKFAELKQSLRSALRALRVKRSARGPAAGRSAG